MTEVSVSLAANLTNDLEVGSTGAGIARAMFRAAVSGRRDQEASLFTVILWRDQAEHAAESLAKGSRVVVVAACSSAPGSRGQHRPLRDQGTGRGAGTQPALGDGDDQGDEEPRQVAGLTSDATSRTQSSMPASRSVVFVLVSW